MLNANVFAFDPKSASSWVLLSSLDMKRVQSLEVLVYDVDSKRVGVVPLRFRSNDLIDVVLYVSVAKSTRPSLGSSMLNVLCQRFKCARD